MSTERAAPNYPLADREIVTDRTAIAAMFHPLRSAVLDLLTERAATVRELASAVGRPPSTVAYHVDVLKRAGLICVVGIRRVRAVEERFYGRTARIFQIGETRPDELRAADNYLVTAAADSKQAHHDDDLRAVLRHARITDADAHRFWQRVLDLVDEFSAQPRAGDVTFAFVAAVYPTDQPSLPLRDPEL